MRQHHNSASPWEERIGFSRGLRTGNRILVAGTAPIGRDGNTVDGGAYEQAQRCFAIILETVEALGGRSDDVVRVRMFLTDRKDIPEVSRAFTEAVGHARPVATQAMVAGLNEPAWRVEIEAEAVIEPR